MKQGMDIMSEEYDIDIDWWEEARYGDRDHDEEKSDDLKL